MGIWVAWSKWRVRCAVASTRMTALEGKPPPNPPLLSARLEFLAGPSHVEIVIIPREAPRACHPKAKKSALFQRLPRVLAIVCKPGYFEPLASLTTLDMWLYLLVLLTTCLKPVFPKRVGTIHGRPAGGRSDSAPIRGSRASSMHVSHRACVPGDLAYRTTYAALARGHRCHDCRCGPF